MNIKTLQLMLAMEPFYNGLRKPKKTAQLEDSDNAAHSQGTIETNIAKSFRKMVTVLLLNINVTKTLMLQVEWEVCWKKLFI